LKLGALFLVSFLKRQLILTNNWTQGTSKSCFTAKLCASVFFLF